MNDNDARTSIGGIGRRGLMDTAASALAFSAVTGTFLTPRQARAQGVALTSLTPNEAALMEAVGETLAVGARVAGIANFIDQQCSFPPQEALLGLRMAGASPPFVAFYRAALAEIDRQSRTQSGAAFTAMAPPDQRALIDRMRRADLPDWRGPSQPLVFNVLRGDAVDVVYGTIEGFDRLGVPYMPHIPPAARW